MRASSPKTTPRREQADDAFKIPRPVSGVVLAVLAAFVLVGGIKRIGSVAGKLVPFMCGIYLLAGLSVVVMYLGDIPAMFALIWKHGAPEFLGGEPAAATGAFIVEATTSTAAIAPSTPSTLGALLLHQFTELAVLKHLAEGAHSETENRNGGAQIERLLQRARGAHLVVAQADAEATTFSVSTGWSASTVASAASFSARALAASVSLNSLLLGIAAVRITHGLRPGIRRKCAASSVCCP